MRSRTTSSRYSCRRRRRIQQRVPQRSSWLIFLGPYATAQALPPCCGTAFSSSPYGAPFSQKKKGADNRLPFSTHVLGRLASPQSLRSVGFAGLSRVLLDLPLSGHASDSV